MSGCRVLERCQQEVRTEEDWSLQEAYCYHILQRNVGVISHIILDMHGVILLNGNHSHRLGYILIIEYSIKTRLLVRQDWWGPVDPHGSMRLR